MKNAVIIEDEKNAQSLLQYLCEKHCDLTISGCATNIEDGERLIRQHNPAIVFLDISLPGHNGFELIPRFNPIPFHVIFVTAFDAFALEAIRNNAVDYLLKPVDLLELKAAVIKAQNAIRNAGLQDEIMALMKQMSQTDQSKKIAIASDKGVEYIEIKDIIHCQAKGRYTEIYMHGNRTTLVSRNLGEFDELLSPLGFIRVHHSHLVNPHHIRQLEKQNGGFLRMSNDKYVEISRRKKEDLMISLKKYVL